MNIAFRVDASTQIGTGHIMRCLTLADTLKQHGAQIRFVSRHMPEYLRDMLVVKGHEFMLLDSSQSDAISDGLSHAHWLGTSQHADAQDTVQALSDQTWDWLVVDHYALDSCLESVLRQIAKNIFVVDDVADCVHDCDVLLDQNFYADMHTRYTEKAPAHCQLLLGPRYALLREEFRQLREQVRPRTQPVKRILIFFGGVDADNYTGRALEVMERVKSWEQIAQTGSDITNKWKALAEKYGLSIATNGLPVLTGFSFDSQNAPAYKMFTTQEMLAKGYLAATSVYVCTEHTPEIVSNYFEALEPIFALVKECEEGRDMMSLLKGPVCHGGFKRLN